jgi:hypothetical protein
MRQNVPDGVELAELALISQSHKVVADYTMRERGTKGVTGRPQGKSRGSKFHGIQTGFGRSRLRAKLHRLACNASARFPAEVRFRFFLNARSVVSRRCPARESVPSVSGSIALGHDSSDSFYPMKSERRQAQYAATSSLPVYMAIR